MDSIAQYKATSQEMAQAKDLFEEFLAYSDYKPSEEYEYVEYFIDSIHVRQYVTMEME